MYRVIKHGFIELIVGCMFAGKTSELIRRISVLERAKIKVLIFKPKFDYRHKEFSKLSTHDGDTKHIVYFVSSVEEVKNILKSIKFKVKVLAFDEIQFFNPEFVEYIEFLANKGYRIIAAGLDKGFNDKLFPTVMQLICFSDFITKLQAVCVLCGEMATKTQRINNKKEPVGPENINDVIGGSEVYQARCRKCFIYFQTKKRFFDKIK